MPCLKNEITPLRAGKARKIHIRKHSQKEKNQKHSQPDCTSNQPTFKSLQLESLQSKLKGHFWDRQHSTACKERVPPRYEDNHTNTHNATIARQRKKTAQIGGELFDSCGDRLTFILSQSDFLRKIFFLEACSNFLGDDCLFRFFKVFQE